MFSLIQKRTFFIASPGQIFPNSSVFWKNRKNHAFILNILEGHLGIKSPEDWYNIDFDEFRKLGGKKLLQEYHDCIYETLSSLLPEQNWKWWKFQDLNKNYYQSPQHLKQLLEDIGAQIGVSKLEDWYDIRQDKVIQISEARKLLLMHDNSLVPILKKAYPQYPWKPWRFVAEKHTMPHGYWKIAQNQRDFLEHLGNELGIKTLPDWYQGLSLAVSSEFGSQLKQVAKYHEGSLHKTIQNVFSEYDWKPWLFSIAPANLWEDPKTRRQFFDYIYKELNCTSLEDMYMISREQIRERGGDYLLKRYYGDDHIKALKDIYPEFQWEDWRFQYHAPGYWSFHGNDHRGLVEKLGKLLGVQKLEDWYQLGISDFAKYGCVRILDYYDRSPMKLLMKVYPEFPWQPFRFQKVPRSFWDDKENLKVYIKYLEKQLGIQDPDDWMNVNFQELKEYGISSVLEKFNGLMNILCIVYPHHKFNISSGRGVWKTQALLYKYINELCAKKGVDDAHYNYIHPSFVYESGLNMELDVFIPSLDLAFEYQGHQHYKKLLAFQDADLAEILVRDEMKRNECKKHGITLIEIPYWWDKTKESLFATIHKSRPDIWEHPGNPIPERPPT